MLVRDALNQLEAVDPRELYRKVIRRWEEAYADGTDLVRDVLSLLWAARRGLSEAELLDELGRQGRPLPHAVWSPLYLAMATALVTRSGLLTFAHDFLRTAARDEYLAAEPDEQAAHRRLAAYFQRQPGWTDRRLDELPWQLAAASQWQQLHDALTDQDCFLGLRERNEYELLGYWLQLKPQFDLAASYTAAFARWEHQQPDDTQLGLLANALGYFLSFTAACHAAAESPYRRSLAIDEQSYGPDHPNVATALNNLALLLQATNRLAEAEPLMRRMVEILLQFTRVTGHPHPHLQTVFRNYSGLLSQMGRSEAEILARIQALAEQHGLSFGN